ncbi:MAG: S-methyl-5'-thioinosine phosphorylase [Gammaproteobacteria bacterium]|nr:S-methyl-5'-thioinosine phosphorylase [Gammaproteobacteria bacterium]MCP4088782.1 S-methyl-5'-thioinosine phosphorylase [Gammaproteobacteria bacterium]MCP4275919.1 S-methyl-5'-thioinosine phosphorylase [Gammaproteobacteria bacterium]MCP4832135.1 S-methyl-5'-thioinosine phosphorylase [Gammaproteobacteria bacterium]MCP4928264.1 S-methyl-5'-thioinosine phosphorylase [Gammaproteobacteria bacterium]
MSVVGLIGGSGAALYPAASKIQAHNAKTLWGQPSAPVKCWTQQGHELCFLSRHGENHVIPPHRINYRANIQALADMGVDFIIAMNAVGGIAKSAKPGVLVIPDQLIDYTWGRFHTYFDSHKDKVNFTDFTRPYDGKLSKLLVNAAHTEKLPVVAGGTYAVTQGPRLETAAEIDRLERDGCTIVGMTAMPEAALASELSLPYISCSSVVNYAAGRSDAAIHSEIEAFLKLGVQHSAQLINRFLQDL